MNEWMHFKWFFYSITTYENVIFSGTVDSNGIFVSKGGKLPSKHIIHIAAPADRPGWIRIISNCLSEAERKKFKHVSFPLLGTGISFNRVFQIKLI